MTVTPLWLAPGAGGRMTWAVAAVAQAATTTVKNKAACRLCESSAPDFFKAAGDATLLAGGGERTDLVISAVAAGLARGRGLEAARADAGGGGLDGVARLVQVGLGGLAAADHAGLDEAQLDALGQAAGHLAPGERVHL